MYNQSFPQISLPFPVDQEYQTKIPDFLTDEIDIIKYQELVNIVFQIYSEGSNLTGKKRTYLWNQLFSNIVVFTQNENPESINFLRCASVGVLLFQTESKETYIYLNISIFRNIFQRLNDIPSYSTISKKVGKKSNLKVYNISLLSQYRECIDKLAISFPKCNVGWDLYEISIEKLNCELITSHLSKSNDYKFFDEEIVDSIIDDDQKTFSKLLSQIFHNEKHVNLRFTLTKYKLPGILSDNPTYADLCSFFQAQKCLTTMCLYLTKGLDEINQSDNKSRTLLHFAAAGGCINIVQELLDTGFDMNNIDADGYSPSHYAAMFGHVDVLKLFNEKGADIFNSNFPSFLNPFQVACHIGNLNVVNYFFQIQVYYKFCHAFWIILRIIL
ncbi:Histone-lysine N-methyltransferase ehmt1 [Tritrichomonas musculus]|uniref:Histone-lysine N-methyltransferase ehmt1 n=1 Tax=Tritrichomonas musculus TaxID=1915356 RepID=A0ABR2K3H0_9EUKA